MNPIQQQKQRVMSCSGGENELSLWDGPKVVLAPKESGE